MAEDSYSARMGQYANAPLQQRYIASYMGNLPDYGTLFGTTHMGGAADTTVPAGAPRPLTPGQYIQNPGGGWSSEISMTIPHPTKPGRWTNIPSVWVVNGRPQRLTDAQALQAARASGLNWPEYASAQEADSAAAQRETRWGNLGREGAAQAPPLWTR